MFTENLSQLEERIQAAIDTIGLQRLEIDELQEEKAQLKKENSRLQEEVKAWNERIESLVGRLDQAKEDETVLSQETQKA